MPMRHCVCTANQTRTAGRLHLAPEIVDACLANDGGIALEHLIRNGSLPLDWQQQRGLIAARA